MKEVNKMNLLYCCILALYNLNIDYSSVTNKQISKMMDIYYGIFTEITKPCMDAFIFLSETRTLNINREKSAFTLILPSGRIETYKIED